MEVFSLKVWADETSGIYPRHLSTSSEGSARTDCNLTCISCYPSIRGVTSIVYSHLKQG